MFCPICGKEIDEGVRICDLCGAEVMTEPETETEKRGSDAVQSAVVESEGATEAPANDVYGAATVPAEQAPVLPVAPYNDVSFGNGPFMPSVPAKKKMKKWPIVLACSVLAFAVAVYSIFYSIFSQPIFVLTNAYNNTLVLSDSLSVEVEVELYGEEYEFEGKFMRGETPEENLFYFVWDTYVDMEAGFCNGKLYSSIGEFDLEDEAQWDEIETALEEECGVEADIEDIYMRLTAEDLTYEEKAAIYDDEIFPIIENVIYVLYDEEVEIPPYADIVTSLQLFYAEIPYTYVVLEELESDEGHLYSYEIDVEQIITDFLDYVRVDETLSQVADIADIVCEGWDDGIEDMLDEFDLTIDGEILVNDAGYLDTIQANVDELEIRIRFYDVNETDLDESDIKDIDVLFDMSDMMGIYGDDYGPVLDDEGVTLA